MKTMQEIRDTGILRNSLAGWDIENYESPNDCWTWKATHPSLGKASATDREQGMAFNALSYQIDLLTWTHDGR